MEQIHVLSYSKSPSVKMLLCERNYEIFTTIAKWNILTEWIKMFCLTGEIFFFWGGGIFYKFLFLNLTQEYIELKFQITKPPSECSHHTFWRTLLVFDKKIKPPVVRDYDKFSILHSVILNTRSHIAYSLYALAYMQSEFVSFVS